MPKVFMCPVTIPADTGKKLLMEQLKKQGLQVPAGNILHVCYDLDSERIYLPNANIFSKDNKEYLLKAAEIRIAKDFGGILNVKPIEGSPFTSIRVRAVSSFGYVVNSIKQHFNDKKFVDLPVIEANLARMPTTMKQLPPIFTNKNFTGGYISSSQLQVVSFIDEIELNGRKREKPILVFQQKPPFILLNTSPEIEIKAADKERNVLLGYRDFLYDSTVQSKETIDEKQKQETIDKATNFADLYAAKRFLYLGYPFEEVCSVFLTSSRNFAELYSGIQRLMSAAEELSTEGHPNPAGIPYYVTFKIDPNTFPLKLASLTSGGNKFDPYKQLPYFLVVEYDAETNYILVQTPAFISPDICMKVLKAKNRPLITHYNPAVGKTDVKSTDGVFKEYKIQGEQLNKITALTKHDMLSQDPEKKDVKVEFRTDNRARGVSMSNTEVCNLRRISDYYYACDRIKTICKKRGIPFVDLPVVVGPIERIMGQGTQGGFMSRQAFEKQKLKMPFEIEKGLFVNPPLIAINADSMPGYDEQTTTLIHEYCHNLFDITNPDYEHQYNKKENSSLKDKNPNKWWDMYLSDLDERQAHKEQIKHELISGESPDEIIRDKVGGAITTSNYPIALKMKELVDEAMKEIEREEEENEKPIGTDQRVGRNPQGTPQDRQ